MLRHRPQTVLSWHSPARARLALCTASARRMAVRVGRGYMGKCGRVPLAAEGQECLEARAEKVPCRRNRQPRREIVRIAGCQEARPEQAASAAGNFKLDLPV